MKYQVIKANERGHADHGWLKANHYFSFGDYYDPDKMAFGKIRVINDDEINPSMGFATHSHKNMEIITIPLLGAVKHKDSEGNNGVIKSGEVQVMSAGSGIRHSEFNASATDVLKLFQIWIEPNQREVAPRYDQKEFTFSNNEWASVVSPVGSAETQGVKIHQDAYISFTMIEAGKMLSYHLKSPENGVYLIAVDGALEFEGESLGKRDALALTGIEELTLKAKEETRIVLIETPLG